MLTMTHSTYLYLYIFHPTFVFYICICISFPGRCYAHNDPLYISESLATGILHKISVLYDQGNVWSSGKGEKHIIHQIVEIIGFMVNFPPPRWALAMDHHPWIIINGWSMDHHQMTIINWSSMNHYQIDDCEF